jgi:putative acetyltransferase
MSDAATIRLANGAADIATVATLFREYQTGLGVSLCFQDFDAELAQLPGAYAEPAGCILLAERAGAALGAVALRPIDRDTGEMKRLYLRDAARGLGIGRKLAVGIMQAARDRGYRRMRLDTLPKLAAAIALYGQLGFRLIAPYNDNPLPGVLFMEAEL